MTAQPPELEGRIIRAQSGFYEVETSQGPVTAVLKGILKKERLEEGLPALGDNVRLSFHDAESAGAGAVTASIVQVLPRRTCLSRRAPGPKGAWARDVIVANIDQLLPVIAVSRPAPNFRLLDRFLALAEMDELDSVIVANKVDQGIAAPVARMLELYRAIGYQVLQTSAESGEGIDALKAAMGRRTSALVGASGVGKSSLLNAVEPGLGLRIGAIGEAVGKGRHTTRVGELHLVASGGRVADTPGLRELGLWEVDPGELEWAFVEFRPLLNTCRFYDCTHVHEPGCAVRAAVESGDVSAERYESYVRLLDDE